MNKSHKKYTDKCVVTATVSFSVWQRVCNLFVYEIDIKTELTLPDDIMPKYTYVVNVTSYTMLDMLKQRFRDWKRGDSVLTNCNDKSTADTSQGERTPEQTPA